MTTDRLDWKNKIISRIKEILLERRARGIPKATVRGIFYILVSLNLIPNLQGAYKGLSRALVQARERKIIPDNWIADESRHIIDIDDVYQSPEELIDDALDDLEDLPENCKERYIPRWYRQPVYVEIWVEKAGIANVFKAILDPPDGTHKERRQVRIIPNSGWTSRTYWIANANRLIAKSRTRPDNVVVLYFGDYDPSGSKMVKKLKEMLEEYEIDFRSVAITKKQIRQFHLEHLKNTDPLVLAKLKRDNNRFEFMQENEGQLFQIELDALEALRPNDLRDLLLKCVDDLFDDDTYKEVMNDPKHQPDEIMRLVIKKLLARARELKRRQQQR